jgi:diguanylate cyclase
MRYRETRERAAEILRLALPLMARQNAALHPFSYALWYEHCAGLNPALSRVLEARLASDSPLNEEEVWRLYAQHIAARDVEAFERLQQDLRKILTDTAASTEAADERTHEIDKAFVGRAEQLVAPVDAEALRITVTDLLGDTGKMRAVTAELCAKLKASTNEVNVLTENLQRAQSEALLDALTGLKNRRGFERAMEELQSEPAGLEGAALLIADIDHFKAINDTHGHLLGDKVLRAIAQVLRSNIKGRDVAARLGGEEFAILLPGTSAAGAAALAKQICASVARGRIHHGDVRGPIGQVTLSVGVAVASKSETLEGLMERADRAMYAAKRAGRNRVETAASESTAV